MDALYEVFRSHRHIVTQIVKAELVVSTKCDVGLISFATSLGIGLMLVDAIHAETMEHVERSHPFGVTLGQIVVHRHHMNTIAGEGVEEYGEGCHEGLTFTCCHLGDFTLMKHDTTKELYVIVNHVPRHLIAASHPVVVPNGLVAINIHKVVLDGEVAVEICGSHDDVTIFSFGKTACRVLHDGINCW